MLKYSKIFHDVGVFLVGVAAIWTLCRTDGLLDKVMRIQDQASSIEFMVTQLYVKNALSAASKSGELDTKKFYDKMLESNTSNKYFLFKDPQKIFDQLEEGKIEPDDLLNLSSEYIVRKEKEK